MEPATIRTMLRFLIEVPLAHPDARELRRAMRLLNAARSRMGMSMPDTRTVFAGISREDGRLVCLIESPSRESARRMLGLALLPPGRIREITDVADADLLGGRHPGGDVDPGAETELVEDVVDVGLDGPLGQE